MNRKLTLDQIKDLPRTIDRFHRSYEIDGVTGCWMWIPGPASRYATIRITTTTGAPLYQASHLSLALDGRPLPEGMFACHTCDCPRCVAPGHLFVGTHQDNMTDMKSKGRKLGHGGPSGEGNGRAKISRDDVDFIRSLPAQRGLLSELAREYGLHPGTIKRIRDYEIWK